MKRILLFCVVLSILGSTNNLLGQDRISEKDLSLDQLFMDANLEKLIGNTDKAIKAFKSIMENYPNHPVAAYELSRLYATQDSLDNAIKMAVVAVQEDEGNKWYKLMLAELYGKVDKNEDAAKLFDGLIAAEPRNDQYYYKQAFFLVKANDIKGALKVYDMLETKVGMTEETVRRKHTLFLGMGDYKKAGLELQRLTKAFPSNVKYLSDLAGFYEQIDDKKAARAVYQQILSIDPKNPKANMVVAGGDVKGNDDLTYLSSLKEIFDDPGVNLDLKIGKIMPLLQKLLKDRNRPLADGLLELTDILERVHPDDAKPFAAAGDILINSGRSMEAVKKYEQAIDLDDTILSVWEQLQYAQLVTGDAQGLVKYGEQALDIFPNQANIYHHTALGFLGLNDPDEAMYLLEQALMMSGKNKGLQQNIISAIGLCYTVSGDASEAADAFKESLNINSQSPLVNTRYALYLAQNNQVDKAEEILKKIATKGQLQPSYVEAKVALMLQKGQNNEAASLIDQFMSEGPEAMPRTIEYFGDVYSKAGASDKAVELWTEAQQKGIKSAGLKKKISDRKL